MTCHLDLHVVYHVCAGPNRCPPEYSSAAGQLHLRQRACAASRRRLNRSRRQLLTFLATVPEAQMLDLKSRAGTWVKYATYGHYDEHLAGLQEYHGKLDMK